MPISSALYAAAIQDQITRKYTQKPKYTILSTRQKQLLRWSKQLTKPVKITEGDEIQLKQENTLAEKLGIIKTHILSPQEWSRVKDICMTRRETECPICKCEYTTQQQIILSCTHLFHRSCFDSFKRLAKCEACPICRCETYQTMTTYHGKHAYIQKCATLIQKTWRGYVERKKYVEYRQTHAPKNPMLKQKFVLQKLDVAHSNLSKQIERDCESLKKVIEMMDSTSLQAKQLLKPKKFRKEWIEAFKKAQQRGNDTCPICIQSINLPHRIQSKLKKVVYLLDCSHVIHASCLQSLEKYTHTETNTRSCPLCRIQYKKKLLGK